MLDSGVSIKTYRLLSTTGIIRANCAKKNMNTKI